MYDLLFDFYSVLGSGRGEPRGSAPTRNGGPKKVLPIETPSLPLNELNRLTGNFGQKALIGEGSYGRVFSATLSNGQSAAIKKLDASSGEPDDDFESQVRLLRILVLGIVYRRVRFDMARLRAKYLMCSAELRSSF